MLVYKDNILNQKQYVLPTYNATHTENSDKVYAFITIIN